MEDKNWFLLLFREIKINPGIKSKLIIFLYRLSSLRYNNRLFNLIFLPIHLFYFILVDFIMGVEIKPRTKIGWGLVIYHPVAIIINPNTIIGKNCIIRHCLTIGNKFNRVKDSCTDCPIIGNNVEFGANTTIIGAIKVGDNAIIGANVFLDYSVNNFEKVLPLRGCLYSDKVKKVLGENG